MIYSVSWPYRAHWWVGSGVFMIRLYLPSFSRSFAGKIIVPVHLNSTPSSYLNFLCFKTLKIRAWIDRNTSVFAAQTSAGTQSAILKKQILSGISFAKINKTCRNYPLKLISLAIRKRKKTIRDRFTKRHPRHIAVQTDCNKPHVPKWL